MRRVKLLPTIALTLLSFPPPVCANGFEHFTEGLILFYLLLPFGMCCAGLTMAMRRSRPDGELLV